MWSRSSSRDPRQARVLTLASLRWVIRERAWTWFYLVRYWRYAMLRLRHPEVVTEGFVFLGRRVVVDARSGLGRIILGRWVHLGDGNQLRAHEGTLRIGDKCVFGRENTVNCYLDVEIGARTLVADWVHVTDFDHRFDDIHMPVKDQGIVKTPVRIGPDCWLGVKSTVLRGSVLGRGSVVAAHSVVRGVVPELSVVGGVPARVLKDRRAAYEADAARRVRSPTSPGRRRERRVSLLKVMKGPLPRRSRAWTAARRRVARAAPAVLLRPRCSGRVAPVAHRASLGVMWRAPRSVGGVGCGRPRGRGEERRGGARARTAGVDRPMVGPAG